VSAGARSLAVVTGASSGIGLELARCCAQNGFDLVVAADEPRLARAAQELRALGAEVIDVQVDLSEPSGVESLHVAVAATGRPVDALLLNAGIGAGGRFKDISLEDDLRVVDLNVRANVHLAKLVVPDMARRGSGRVLVTSSIAAGLPGTLQATYNASKSFLSSFAAALRTELRDDGVTVTALLPGPTDTALFGRAPGMEGTLIAEGPKDDPVDVAAAGFAAMMAGKERVVAASLRTKVEDLVLRLLPDAVTAQLNRVMAAPRFRD
jgi:short-subunit dehydrogenase